VQQRVQQRNSVRNAGRNVGGGFDKTTFLEFTLLYFPPTFAKSPISIGIKTSKARPDKLLEGKRQGPQPTRGKLTDFLYLNISHFKGETKRSGIVSRVATLGMAMNVYSTVRGRGLVSCGREGLYLYT
jgi:hypothetical protein